MNATHIDTPAQVTMEPLEHHDPLGRTDYLSLEHLERYRFAHDQLEPGMRVLDIAAGAGYGSAILTRRGCEVVGADYDERACAIASARCPDATFHVADALDLPFADAEFDAVVTFETIEHVTDGSRFLAEMHRVLRPGGQLICSTPNIAYTRHPDYHLHEYRPEEFFAAVESCFGNVERHGQYFRMRDRLRDLYCWHVQAGVLGIADATGVRPLAKRLLGRSATAAAHEITPQSPSAAGDLADGFDERIRTFLARDADPDHAVRGYSGESMLRIMIAAARKTR